MRASSGAHSSAGSSLQAAAHDVGELARTTSSSICARHGHVATPSCAGTHGGPHSSTALRPIRVPHRRSGTASSIASRARCAAALERNGPRYDAPSARATRVTIEPREPLVGELQVRVAPPRLRLAVEARLEPLDEAQLAHRRLERPAAHAVLDAHRLAQELRHLPPVLGGEVGAHAGAQVGGLADVEHTPAAVAEQVDARQARQLRRERELGRRRVRAHRRQREEIVETEHAERRGPFEQRVQHLGGRGRVGVRAVHRLDRRAEVAGERAERRFGTSSRTSRRASATVSTRRCDEARVAVRDERGVEEAGCRSECCGRRSPRRPRTRGTRAAPRRYAARAAASLR